MSLKMMDTQSGYLVIIWQLNDADVVVLLQRNYYYVASTNIKRPRHYDFSAIDNLLIILYQTT